MNVLIIGSFPYDVQKRIIGTFPSEWKVVISEAESASNYLQDAEVVIPEHVPVDENLISKAPLLRMIQTGAGYDNIDLYECRKRDIVVCNSAGVNANAVAEHTLALILAWFKNIPYLDFSLKTHCSESQIIYTGGEIRGKTIGIIGFGAIGQRVSTLCLAFGLKVLVYSRTPKEFEGVDFVELDALLNESDIVSLHIPANAETYHMIDKSALSKMKKSAILINTARGSIVDENDLISALNEHIIQGACLDVFENEPISQSSKLRDLQNVILTPHTAGLPDGVKFHQARYSFFAENIQRLESEQEVFSRIV